MIPSQPSPLGCCYFWLVWLCCLLLSLSLHAPALSFPLLCLFFPFPSLQSLWSSHLRQALLTLQKRSGVEEPVLTLTCHHCYSAGAAARCPREVWLSSHYLETSASLGVWDCLCLVLFYFGKAPPWQTRPGVLSTKNTEKQNNPQLALDVRVSSQSKPGLQATCSAIFLHRHVLICVELYFCCRSSTLIFNWPPKP